MDNILIKKNLAFKVFGLYIIIVSLLYISLDYEKSQKIKKYLNSKTKQYEQNYNATYDAYKKLSNTIYITKIDTQEIKDIFKNATITKGLEQEKIRKELYDKLKQTYTSLKKYNIKQLHFHLPNNDSFLRFHRPNKYGDNLTNIRETVKYVNKNKKYIDGFEEGRIYNGYRFVFPLNVENKHIGSVEISFSTIIFSNEFMNNFDVISPFLISKEIVDKKLFDNEKSNYIDSSLKEFYIEKKTLKNILRYKKLKKYKNEKTLEKISFLTQTIVSKRWQDNESFSLYDKNRKDIMTFIKVQNPISKQIIGMLVVRSDAGYIRDKTTNFYTIMIISSIIILILFLLIYRELKQKGKLELRIKQEIDKNIKKEKVLQEQAKLAQMGEMISMIAHQWRQPLSAISTAVFGIQTKLEGQKFDLEKVEDRKNFLKYIEKKHNSINGYVQSLSTTIDDFRHFFKPEKEKEYVSLILPIQKALNIVSSSMINKGISIQTDLKMDHNVNIYQNEFMQVVLNILKNSEDNFIEKNTLNPKIDIKTFRYKKSYVISIRDNGGGIPVDVLPNIFNPYFSTKEEKNGTGLGLYMSKIMIEDHNNGKLNVKNTDDGVEFNIVIYKNSIGS